MGHYCSTSVVPRMGSMSEFPQLWPQGRLKWKRLARIPLRKEYHVQLSAANVAPTCWRSFEATIGWQARLLDGAAQFDDSQEELAFESLRANGAKLLNCSPQDIAGGSSCSELLGSLAWAVMDCAYGPRGASCSRPQRNIVGTKSCFPSTFYCWRRVAEHFGAAIRLVDHDRNYLTREEDIFSAIDKDTVVVALSHIEFTSGQVYDLERIATRLHEVTGGEGFLIVDGTQSVGMLPIDVQKPKFYADAIASAGYKWLCGAFGGALMWVSPRLQALKSLSPGLVGFRSHHDMWSTDATRLEYPAGAKRFEFATMHFGSALGLAKAIELQLELGLERIWEHNLSLVDHLVERLKASTVLSGEGPDGKARYEVISPLRKPTRSAICSLRLFAKDGVTLLSSAEVVDKLKTDHKVVVTNRGPFVRVSAHYYNDSGDIDRFVEALEQVMIQPMVLRE